MCARQITTASLAQRVGTAHAPVTSLAQAQRVGMAHAPVTSLAQAQRVWMAHAPVVSYRMRAGVGRTQGVDGRVSGVSLGKIDVSQLAKLS